MQSVVKGISIDILTPDMCDMFLEMNIRDVATIRAGMFHNIPSLQTTINALKRQRSPKVFLEGHISELKVCYISSSSLFSKLCRDLTIL